MYHGVQYIWTMVRSTIKGSFTLPARHTTERDGMSQDCVRTAKRILSGTGIEAFELVQGGKHPRLVLSCGGYSRFVVLPSSGSDSRRGLKNFIAQLRREAKHLGAILPPRSKPSQGRVRIRNAAARHARPNPVRPDFVVPALGLGEALARALEGRRELSAANESGHHGKR